MSNAINISFPKSEQEKFRRWTNSLSATNKRNVQMLITSTAMNAERRAKMFSPVDKGFLKTSINHVLSADKLSASVFTHRDYAPYVEFGTGRLVSLGNPGSLKELYDISAYAMQFKGRGIRKHNQRAQPYLFPAMRISVSEMKEKLKTMGFKEK